MSGGGTDLGDGQNSDKVEPKIFPQVPSGNFLRISDKVAATENTSGRLNVPSSKLQAHVNHVEKIRHGAQHRHTSFQPRGDVDAVVGILDLGQVVEQRVHGDRHQARRHEKRVPSMQGRTRWIQRRCCGLLRIVLQVRRRQALELQ